VANGAQETLTLQALVVSSAPRTNTASISHADQFDPNTNNNSSSATETPQRADLALAKSIDNPKPNVGDTVTFTITLSNAGPDAATGVVVNDALPAGLTLLTSNPSQGSYSAGVWDVGIVTPSVSQTLILTTRVVSPLAQTNIATIGHSDQFDPVGANNSASATETPQRSDLALTKTVSPTAPNVGDTITFVVTLTNKGPDTATDVTITDFVPAGLDLVSADPSLGSYDSGTGLWTISSIPSGAKATLTLSGEVTTAGAKTNTATVTGADQFDPVSSNNSASATATPQQADLSLTKIVSNSRPNVGNTVTFTISLKNNGPNTATNVWVSDLLPVGLTLVSAKPSQGTYNSATGIWTVGAVTLTARPSLQLQARVVSPQAQTNTATIASADQFDPDTANNSASATETPQQADLAVSKAVSNPTPNVGDTVTYTITLTNNGPDAATNVALFDRLPAGVTFVSATPSHGSYDSVSALWTVGTVAAGSSPTLLLAGRIVSARPTTNTAIIRRADQFDPDRSNNQASAVETPQLADLYLAKTVDVPRPHVGDTIVFTLTLTNLGPDEATDVLVNDRLPAGLSFVAATPSQGSYDPSSGVWEVGTVAPGTPQTLRLEAIATVESPLTNTGRVSHADQFDPDLANNAASAVVTPVVPRANLVLVKTVSQAQIAWGMNVTYSFTIRNLGPDAATRVIVNDPFPAGLVVISSTATQGAYNSATGIWNVGTLANGAVAVLKVTARVMFTGPLVNTARASAVELDPALANNVSSVTLIGLNPASILSKRLFLASSR
jgi:uncharacterized repeat protein (TIGR01451 family)